jgi:hypothetical protein
VPFIINPQLLRSMYAFGEIKFLGSKAVLKRNGRLLPLVHTAIRECPEVHQGISCQRLC